MKVDIIVVFLLILVFFLRDVCIWMACKGKTYEDGLEQGYQKALDDLVFALNNAIKQGIGKEFVLLSIKQFINKKSNGRWCY